MQSSLSYPATWVGQRSQVQNRCSFDSTSVVYQYCSRVSFSLKAFILVYLRLLSYCIIHNGGCQYLLEIRGSQGEISSWLTEHIDMTK